MKQVFWMATVCVSSWLVAAALTDRPTETFLGMAGPLAAAGGTWLAVDRTWRRDPARLTRLLMGALFLKLVFFGLYTIAVSQIDGLDLGTWAVAFLIYFAGLYAAQGLLLRSLMTPQAS